jgi:dephospho-CoA kinase
MFAGKPIIGLTGGIGSGKSFVASVFGELGCLVISSDELVGRAYDLADVKTALRAAWGPDVFLPGGAVDRQAVANRIFHSPADRAFVEQLLHPRIAVMRTERMQAASQNPAVLAFVWDTPLLLETDLHRQCDVIVFVETPKAVREQRVREQRGWSAGERQRREKLQLPLDRKREMADYSVRGATDADEVRNQVREILSQIRTGFELGPQKGYNPAVD